MKLYKINGLENKLWGVYRQGDKDRILSQHEKLVDAIFTCDYRNMMLEPASKPKSKPKPKPERESKIDSHPLFHDLTGE